MKLVELKDTGGNTSYVNPDHVCLVSQGASQGVPVLGQSAVLLINGMALSIDGIPADVSAKLSGQDKLHWA